MKPLAILALIALFALPIRARSQILAGWSLQARDLSGDITANDVAPHIVGGVIRRGPALTPDLSIGNGYGAIGWATSTTFPGIASTGYYSFSLTVEPGWAVNLTTMDISFSSPGGTNRVNAVELRSAVDGFATPLFVHPGVGFSGDDNTIALSGMAGLTGTIEFRLWGYQADSPTALFLLDNDNHFPIAGSTHGAVRFNGTVIPVGPRLSIRCSQVEVCWQSDSNKTYQLQYRSSLTTNLWADLGAAIQGDGTRKCIMDSVAEGQPQRYYRAIATPQ